MTRPDSRSWTKAKEAGDAAELAVARMFGLRGFECLKTIGRAPYDLLLQARTEVKHDLQAATSGFVAVEVTCNGQPSGIMATSATFWTIVVGDRCTCIPTKRLRDLAMQPRWREVTAGDRGATRCRLVALEDLRKEPFAKSISLSGLDA